MDNQNQSNIQQAIIQKILAERIRQDEMFGVMPRNLKPSLWLAVLIEEVGEVARTLIEPDPIKYEEECIQVAAVALAMLEDYWTGEPSKSLEKACGKLRYVSEQPSSDDVQKQQDLDKLLMFLDQVGIQFTTNGLAKGQVLSIQGVLDIDTTLSVDTILRCVAQFALSKPGSLEPRIEFNSAYACGKHNAWIRAAIEYTGICSCASFPYSGFDAMELIEQGLTSMSDYPIMHRWTAP